MQKDRLKKMHARKPRLKALLRGAGRARAARLWTSGVLPSVGHGEAESVSRKTLDPMYHASSCLLQQYSARVFGRRGLGWP
eukprot:6654461-Pyramimonas_sp.AAC.1